MKGNKVDIVWEGPLLPHKSSGRWCLSNSEKLEVLQNKMG